jgi:hypothetical protein
MTPEGARAIGPDDRLQLAPPPNTGRPQISSQQAGKLAVSLAKHFLPYTHSFWDNQRGRTIDYQKLVVCNTPVYAASPFERLEMDDPTTQAHYLQ